MGAYLVRRLISVVPLVVGVVAVVFAVFDSGLLGDPSMALAGRHADTAMIARYDRELGLVEDWHEDAVRLTLHGPPEATGVGRLTFHEDRLTIDLPDHATVLALDSGDLQDVVGSVRAGHVEGQWYVTAELTDPGLGGEPLAGLGAAQRTGTARLFAGAPVGLDWARPVPAWRRFLGDLRALATLDFGSSLRTRQPITDQIALRVGPSLGLAIPAFALTAMLSLTLALVCARRRSGALDRTVLVACSAGMSVTVLAFILLGQKWLAYDLGLFPVYGFSAPVAIYLALPVLIWVAAALGPEVRLYRTLLLESASGGHVTAARTRGLSPAAAYRSHVLRGALVPIVTHLVGALPFLFLGSLLLERFFGIPGLGDYIVEAVFAGDPPVLKAMTFLVALGFIAAHVAGDLLCALADPRLRLS